MTRQTFVLREAVRERFPLNLLLEQIPFIQEQDKRRVLEPPRIANLLEQSECLMHYDDVIVLQQVLIVTA